jgi:predicted RNA-binding protein YlxR (DUF448 family)
MKQVSEKIDKKPITKEQHFVPQFYLKKFLNQEGKLEILDCERLKIVANRTPKNVCKGEYFYSTNDKIDEVSQLLEDELSRLEDGISKKYDEITNIIIEGKQMSFEDRVLVATFMASLYTRGVYMRKQIKKMSANTIKQIMKLQFESKNIDKQLNKLEEKLKKKISKKERKELIDFVVNGEYDVMTNNASHLRFMAEMEGFRNLFLGKYWTIYISKSSKKFITSDNPVIETFPDWHGKMFWGATFLQRTHHFSLTPEIMIVATNSDNLNHKNIYVKRIKRKTLFDNKKDNDKILELNFVYPRFAEEYVYSINKESLKDIIDSANLYDKQIKEKQKMMFNEILKEIK